MALHHIGLAKTIAWGAMAVGTIVIALDPSEKVAFIMAGGMVIASLPALIIGLMNRKELKVIKVDVNTNFQKLLREKEDQNKEMAQKTTDLAHAQGWKEGSQSERDKT